jgi:hypothetical protein
MSGAGLQYDIISGFQWRRQVGFAKHFPQLCLRGPAHLRDRDVIRAPFKRVFGALSDSVQRRVYPGNQYTEGDDQPDHVSPDHSLDAFIELVEFPEQPEGKQKAEQFDDALIGFRGLMLPRCPRSGTHF